MNIISISNYIQILKVNHSSPGSYDLYAGHKKAESTGRLTMRVCRLIQQETFFKKGKFQSEQIFEHLDTVLQSAKKLHEINEQIRTVQGERKGIRFFLKRIFSRHTLSEAQIYDKISRTYASALDKAFQRLSEKRKGSNAQAVEDFRTEMAERFAKNRETNAEVEAPFNPPPPPPPLPPPPVKQNRARKVKSIKASRPDPVTLNPKTLKEIIKKLNIIEKDHLNSHG
ncbi:MAG: hypothetical protein ACK5MA_04930 [Parachlamydiaceae bacterium]